jgi:peptidoglycan/xylan/chitin deacetylase (PgdA/CDA1 family)
VANPEAATRLDEGVVDVTPQQLDRQLAFLRRWFDPIGLEDLLAFVRRGAALPANPVLVTFDDGYRDNHDTALPILRRHGVRATFFVATDYVDRRRPYWWDRVAFVLKGSARERIELAYPEPMQLALGDASERRAAVRRVSRVIKDRRGLDLDRFLAALEDAAGLTLGAHDERRLVEQTVMTWEHVVALRRAGMAVGSHTRTHRVLQTLDAAQIADELGSSRRKLEDVLGEPVMAISYPVGKPLWETPHLERAVREAGYELGFSNGTGVNRVRDFHPLDVRRISLELGITDAFFRSMLAIPWLAY